MKAIARGLGRTLRRLYRDERGANMVEYLLLILLVALPLLAVVLVFRNELWSLIRQLWDSIKGQTTVPD
jgi:Flp pilus assembly pilin Flp